MKAIESAGPLSEYAFSDLDAARQSRAHNEENNLANCSPFQLDKERIIRSKAFRRLKHKTQLFVTPRNDLFRTRMTHTLEAAQVARRIACALGLNEDLAEAIVLAHDIGHPPFGHAGERALNDCVKAKASAVVGKLDFRPVFDHNEQSLVILKRLEVCGAFPGLNLTTQVLQGVQFRDASSPKASPEAAVADFADDLTYINHDFQDLSESGILASPPENLVVAARALGKSYEERIATVVEDIVSASTAAGRVAMSDDKFEKVAAVKNYFKTEVIRASIFRYKDEEARHILTRLFEVYTEGDWPILERYVPRKTVDRLKYEGRIETTINHIACMTDDYALHQYERILMPKIWEYDF